MPYSYRESTRLSRENSLALKSLAATGELPKDHYWNTLRERHDANPVRFGRNNNPVINALLNRDAAQRAGTLDASAPLLPNTKFFAYAGAKHALNMTRFDHWHPFLGRLFEIILPTPPVTPAGQGLTPPVIIPPVNPAGNIDPPPAGGGGGGDAPPGGGDTPSGGDTPPPSGGDGGEPGTGTNPPPPIPTATVPEPASVMMMGMALFMAAVFAALLRKRARRPVAAPTPALA